MEFPVFADYFDNGNIYWYYKKNPPYDDPKRVGHWGYGDGGLLYPIHYTQLAELTRRQTGPQSPFTGAFCVQVPIQPGEPDPDPSTDYYMAITPSNDMGLSTGEEFYVSFWLLVPSTLHYENGSEFNMDDLLLCWDDKSIGTSQNSPPWNYIKLTYNYGSPTGFALMFCDSATMVPIETDKWMHVCFNTIHNGSVLHRLWVDGEEVANDTHATDTRIISFGSKNKSLSRGYVLFDRIEFFKNERPQPIPRETTAANTRVTVCPVYQDEESDFFEQLITGPGELTSAHLETTSGSWAYVDLFDTDRAQDRAAFHLARIHAGTPYEAIPIKFRYGVYAVIKRQNHNDETVLTTTFADQKVKAPSEDQIRALLAQLGLETALREPETE